jgi:pilus assembly protein Flp/PilA
MHQNFLQKTCTPRRNFKNYGTICVKGYPPEQSLAMSKIAAFLTNESGATAIEYALIAAGISVAIIATVNALGTQLTTTFSNVSSQMK